MPLGARPEGARLPAGLRTGDVVVVPKLDRMFRSVLDALDVLARLRKDGVALHMLDLGGDVTGGGVAKLVFSILSAVAEAERDGAIERIRDVKRDQKKRGRYLGGVVPFGYRLGEAGALVAHAAEQDAIRRASHLRAGGASLRGIAAALEADGHALSHVGVRKVLAAADGRAPADSSLAGAIVAAPVPPPRVPPPPGPLPLEEAPIGDLLPAASPEGREPTRGRPAVLGAAR